MQLELNKYYKDRSGKIWKVCDVQGQSIAPITAYRWEGKQYLSRTFQRDGRYFRFNDDKWDLIEEVTAP